MSESLMNLEAFFSPGGPLSRILAAYEHRAQQVEMSRAVASALADRGNLIVEAGTGVGKSLAYLLPAFLHAQGNEEPVVVSTYTINLQEQLLEKDIPLLESALGREIRAVVAKGRGNYV
jgi:ATP-dependent DNA helicase DinG